MFPKNLAKPLTSELEKQLSDQEKKAETNRRHLVEDRQQIVVDLQGKQISFTLKTGAGDKVYGGISEKDILKEIKKQFHHDLSRKHIDLPG